MAIVAFQSAPRIAATVLVSRLTSANASRDTVARYATLVSAVSFFCSTNDNGGTHIPAISGDLRVIFIARTLHLRRNRVRHE